MVSDQLSVGYRHRYPAARPRSGRWADYPETYDLHVQPHNCAGPVATAAAVQLDACITNCIIQEWSPYRDQGLYDLVEGAQETRAVNGRYAIPDLPGLGVTLNEAAVGRYPRVRVP